MGSIFALVFVLTAAAASFVPIPPRNYFDGVRPELFDGKDSYVQNYWTNLAMPYNRQYWNGPVPFSYEYQTRNFYVNDDQVTIKDIFEKPLIAITPSPTVRNTFTAFYLHDGLRSLYRFKNLSWLLEHVKTPGMKSLVFFPNYLYNVRFFETPISSVVIQEDCRMSDFSMISGSSYKVPYIFIAPESVFDEMKFDNLAKISDLKVHSDIIEILSPFSWLPNKVNYNDRMPGLQVIQSSSPLPAPANAQPESVAESQGLAGQGPDGARSRSLLEESQGITAAQQQSIAVGGSVASETSRSFATSESRSQTQSSSTLEMST